MRNLPVLLAVPLVVAFGITEGRWTNRWGWSDELDQATARLAGVPREVGDWEGHDDTLNPRSVVQAGVTGYVLRHFENRRTGAAVSMLLVCGPSGPTSLHSPDVCYPGAGYAMAGPPERHGVRSKGLDQRDEFWVTRFQRGGPAPDPVRVYWAWTAAGDWQAPDSPRLRYAGLPALYKLYVIRPLARADETMADDPSTDFMRTFLPEVRKALFPTS